MSRRFTCSVIIPVYNSEASLEILVERLEAVLQEHTETYEIILVNDSSTDDSWSVINRLVTRHDNILGIDLMRNYGQHAALLCGIKTAQNDLIVTMDDDLQHPPEELPKLLNALGEHIDVVYGTPKRECHVWWRNRASILTKLTLSIVLGVEVARFVSAFRVFRRSVCKSFFQFRGPFVSIDVLLSYSTRRVTAVSVNH